MAIMSTIFIGSELKLRLTWTTLDGQEIHSKENLLIGLSQVHGNKAVMKKMI